MKKHACEKCGCVAFEHEGPGYVCRRCGTYYKRAEEDPNEHPFIVEGGDLRTFAFQHNGDAVVLSPAQLDEFNLAHETPPFTKRSYVVTDDPIDAGMVRSEDHRLTTIEAAREAVRRSIEIGHVNPWLTPPEHDDDGKMRRVERAALVGADRLAVDLAYANLRVAQDECTAANEAVRTTREAMLAWRAYDENGQAQSSAPLVRHVNALKRRHRARYIARKANRAWLAINHAVWERRVRGETTT